MNIKTNFFLVLIEMEKYIIRISYLNFISFEYFNFKMKYCSIKKKFKITSSHFNKNTKLQKFH